MKILSVRFRNLNSLAGEWMINLQDPSFTSTGIFAITGPTGSGKTTILDAICLALYGQTPRLEKISVSTNEIMTRHTGECSAEVTFESSEGVFRCNWRQKRARNRPDGKLQQPEHEIVDVVTDQVLESKIREVGIRVRQVTGMDFEQFTRSMLLAQGGFSAFLEAKPDERAPILEQITGTKIYSDISIKVHDRTGEEREKFKALDKEIGMIQLLTPEEEAALIAEMETKGAVIVEKSGDISKMKKILDGLGRIAGLKRDLITLNNEQENLVSQREQAGPDLNRLNIGRKATGFETAWKVLIGMREKQQQDADRLTELKDQEALIKEAYLGAEDAHIQAEREHQAALLAADKERPVIIAARDIDARITHARALVTDRIEKLAVPKERKKKAESEMVALDSQRSSYFTDLQRTEGYLQDHAGDALLIRSYSGLNQQIHEWINNHEILNRLSGDLGTVEELRNKAGEDLQKKKDAVEKHGQDLAEFSRKITELNFQLSALLQDSDILDIRVQEKNLQRCIDGCKKLADIALDGEILRNELNVLIEKSGSFQVELRISEKARTDKILHCMRQEELIGSLETAVRLAARVRDLEDERAYLSDGNPCPLCGSVMHPYTSEGIPQFDQTDEKLAEAKGIFKQMSAEVTRLESLNSALNGELSRNLEDLAVTRNRFADVEEVWAAGTLDLHLDPAVSDRVGFIRSELSTYGRDIIAISSRISQADECDKKLRQTQQSLAAEKDRYILLIKEETDAGYIYRGNQVEIERLNKEIADQTRVIDIGLNALQEALAPYQTPVITPTSIIGICDDLKKRCEEYILNQSRKNELDSSISTLSNNILSITSSLKIIDEEIADQRAGLDKENANLSGLLDDRSALYGTRDPSVEEERSLTSVRIAEEKRVQSRKGMSEKRSVWDTLTGKIQSLSESVDHHRKNVQDQTGAFLLDIQSAGYPDEISYQAALLPPDELIRLDIIAAGLEKDETALLALIRDKQQTLVQEEKKWQVSQSYEEIEQGILKAEQWSGELQQEIGGIKTRLEEDKGRKEKISDSLPLLESQRRERDRWDRLHALIGSADGKKFRIFAQGLTFQLLIAQANRHLQLMSDRYILRPDPDTPLDLAVIDLWQAGEVRSTRNLSGGESFIVSLALALGLSGMASKNVRVDSLFLDEGFGTLDDEALDTALGALSGLHHQGKLIGIISHVPAIRERISTRIVVEKGNNGRSVIIAPGCTKIS